MPIPSDAYEGEPVMLPFEDDEYPVPRGYEQFLSLSYGDYMTPLPEKDRVYYEVSEYKFIDVDI